jgi:hypothetical protein
MDIDYAKAVAMLEAARDSKPAGFCYTRPTNNPTPGCKYVHKDADGALTVPGCMIGTAFLAEGLCTPETFADSAGGFGYSTYKGYTLNDVNSADLMTYLVANKGHRFTNKAQVLISRVQSKQDIGASWADALSASVAEIETPSDFSDEFFEVTLSASE